MSPRIGRRDSNYDSIAPHDPRISSIGGAVAVAQIG